MYVQWTLSTNNTHIVLDSSILLISRSEYKASAHPCPLTVPTCWPVSVWWDSYYRILSKILSKKHWLVFSHFDMILCSSARVSYFSYPDNADVNKADSNKAAHLVDHLLKKIEEINVWIQLIFGSDRSSRNAYVRLSVCLSVYLFREKCSFF